MRPNEYFPALYLKDLKLFAGKTISGNGPKYFVCGLTLGKKLFPKYREQFIGVEYFIIVLYEMNLINQGIYTHYHIDFYEWCKTSVPFPDCHGCNHGGTMYPGGILRFVSELSSYCTVPVNPVNIELKMLKEYTQFFFKDYLAQLCIAARFEVVTQERLIDSLKNDGNCTEFIEFIKN